MLQWLPDKSGVESIVMTLAAQLKNFSAKYQVATQSLDDVEVLLVDNVLVQVFSDEAKVVVPVVTLSPLQKHPEQLNQIMLGILQKMALVAHQTQVELVAENNQLVLLRRLFSDAGGEWDLELAIEQVVWAAEVMRAQLQLSAGSSEIRPLLAESVLRSHMVFV
ncbi:hypothetical protein C942_02750 [Photobacterium marinum]|uniref:Uncharacterized protein n=1 Tax=Photobacterium marinum TaxID=1056511 RepID=L8JEI0_9GAMM|nr:hypothetical protein [Photobacterium marinum]ELR67241.1 hypothetical protein C942_02750 [Photobacterium marinum]